jgi:hypothetical protein
MQMKNEEDHSDFAEDNQWSFICILIGIFWGNFFEIPLLLDRTNSILFCIRATGFCYRNYRHLWATIICIQVNFTFRNCFGCLTVIWYFCFLDCTTNNVGNNDEFWKRTKNLSSRSDCLVLSSFVSIWCSGAHGLLVRYVGRMLLKKCGFVLSICLKLVQTVKFPRMGLTHLKAQRTENLLVLSYVNSTLL